MEKKERQFLYSADGPKRAWMQWHVLRDVPFLSKWEGSRNAKVVGVGEAANKMFSVIVVQEYIVKIVDVVTHSVMLVQSGDTVPDNESYNFLGTFKHENACWLAFYMGFEEGRL